MALRVHVDSRIHRPVARPVLVVALALVGAAPALAEAPLAFNRDIRPILYDACVACHGPDSAARKGGLRLDQREAAVEARAIVPGDPAASALLKRVMAHEPGRRMPPPQTKKTLSPDQVATLTRWIAEGAPYEPHWSYIAPKKAPLPKVARTAWPRNPIDHFVLASLEGAGLAPADEADRRTLARRVAFDLTGLPPSPEEVERFVGDRRPDAYERLVDRLMESPAWGEHRARFWLDYARYADTNGLHFDNFREMWTYRDWVIGAFNRNLPWDRFTIESLAGDLLPGATLDNKTASGFNRCNITTSEGGAIDEEYLVLYTRDRTEATATVWMGMSAGCAVCHDHKFDPLSQREFYELAAFFNNTTQPAMDGNRHDTPPVEVAPRPEDRARWDRLSGDAAEAQALADARAAVAGADFDAWAHAAQPGTLRAGLPAEGMVFHAPLNEGGDHLAVHTGGAAPERLAAAGRPRQRGPGGAPALVIDGAPAVQAPDAGDFATTQAFSCAAWIKLSGHEPSGGVVSRMEDKPDFRGWDLWIENGRLTTHLIHKWAGDAMKVAADEPLPSDEWLHVAMTYDGSRRPDGVRLFVNGARAQAHSVTNRLKSDIRTTAPLKVGQRNTTGVLKDAAIQDVRVYGRVLALEDIDALAGGGATADFLATPSAERQPKERERAFRWWLVNVDAQHRERLQTLRALDAERYAIRARASVAHVMHERPTPAEAHVLFRGAYDQRRERVTPDTPDFLPPMPEGARRDRLGLAEWLVADENPLTARVTVNRYWQEVFGVGLAETAGDLGVAGRLPSNQPLLDWLAVDFRESGWDVRRLVRLMVTSAAYRQAAVVTPEKLERDPQNHLLSRGPRFRLDAEVVRDQALAVSGLLNPKIGGPSVRPYQPEGVWEAVAMSGSNTRSYKQDSGDALYRRSLYTFWKRSAPPASLELFGGPSREYCVVTRERTNTPLQALVTLNDPQHVEAARRLAERALGASPDPQGRLAYLTRRLLARDFTPGESAIAMGSLDRLTALYEADPQGAARLIATGDSEPDRGLAPVELASWTMLANELMNLDEALNK